MATSEEVFARDVERVSRRVERTLGRRPDRVEPMAAGLGLRRFLRLTFSSGRPASLVARIEDDGARPPPPAEPSPPSWQPEPALEPIRGFLERAGLPVPASHGHHPDLGLDLLEDLGTRTLADARGQDRRRLYAEACRIVAALQSLEADARSVPAFGRRFDRALIDTKAWKWLHWTLPGLLERPASAQEREQTRRLFERLGDLVLAAPMRLSHRDFKAENLHWPERRGDAERDHAYELVMIDVQGAFLAPPEYDLVCLLADLQVELDPAFVEACLAHARPLLPNPPSEELLRLRFDALTVMRLCKDVSHVVHAGRVRGDRRRWHEIPRGLELIERARARLEGPIPEARALSSVIQTLTRSAGTADSPERG